MSKTKAAAARVTLQRKPKFASVLNITKTIAQQIVFFSKSYCHCQLPKQAKYLIVRRTATTSPSAIAKARAVVVETLQKIETEDDEVEKKLLGTRSWCGTRVRKKLVHRPAHGLSRVHHLAFQFASITAVAAAAAHNSRSMAAQLDFAASIPAQCQRAPLISIHSFAHCKFIFIF